MASKNEGPQSIERVARILECLTERPIEGERLSDIAGRCGYPKPVAHRTLNALVDVGYVEQDPETRRYRLGLEIFALAAAAGSRISILHLAQTAIAQLAAKHGDTFFLYVRSRSHAICIDRVSGSFPIKAQTINVGDRVPLGGSAGSLAILANVRDDELGHLIDINMPMLGHLSKFDPGRLHQLVAETRERGYALYEGAIVPGMTAAALPIRDGQQNVVASISIVALSDRLTRQRLPQIVDDMADAIRRIEQRAGYSRV